MWRSYQQFYFNFSNYIAVVNVQLAMRFHVSSINLGFNVNSFHQDIQGEKTKEFNVMQNLLSDKRTRTRYVFCPRCKIILAFPCRQKKMEGTRWSRAKNWTLRCCLRTEEQQVQRLIYAHRSDSLISLFLFSGSSHRRFVALSNEASRTSKP